MPSVCVCGSVHLLLTTGVDEVLDNVQCGQPHLLLVDLHLGQEERHDSVRVGLCCGVGGSVEVEWVGVEG